MSSDVFPTGNKTEENKKMEPIIPEREEELRPSIKWSDALLRINELEKTARLVDGFIEEQNHIISKLQSEAALMRSALEGLAMGTCEKKGCSVVAKEALKLGEVK